MANVITNYDGSITTTPQQLVQPQNELQIQEILRDRTNFPSPVRAKGSYHSLTPCVSSDGTIVDMSALSQVVQIDKANNLFTAQAGMQIIDASMALRQQGLQFMTNIEIGNMTLGAAACCHSKDALDGIQFGQFGSYVTGIKWVTPAGELAEASATVHPELLPLMRGSHGLAGIIYEVTFRVKPVEALHFTYTPRPVDELTQAEVDQYMQAEGLICWTVGRTCVFQQRTKVADTNILSSLEASAREHLWNFAGAFAGHIIDTFLKDKGLRDAVQNGAFDFTKLIYSTLHLTGGITILAPAKTIDYRQTPTDAKYAFTFWAFPRGQWLDTMRAYLDFADQYFQTTGFRCNMPLGAYHIRQDANSILSYTYDEEVFSIDPIHAVTDQTAWANFLVAFNDFAAQRGGKPLLNQSPFVKREHVEAAYGQRWFDLVKWLRTMDPTQRMVNPYFADLMGNTTTPGPPAS
jgi:FAD/FMN-containing dehydrogenase